MFQPDHRPSLHVHFGKFHSKLASYVNYLFAQALPVCCTTYDEKPYRNIEELMNHSTLTAKFIGARISDLI